MNLRQVKAAIKFMWRMKRDGKIKNLPILTLVGDTGIGKSTILSSIAEEYKKEAKLDNIYLQYLFLAQMEVGDLIGMPSADNGKTRWLAPEWLPTNNETGLLVLDELGDADPMTRKAVMPLLLTGKLHTHKMADDVLIVCAMNPVGGNFGGMDFTRQFKNRLLFLKVKTTVDEWLEFAENNNYPAWSKALASEDQNVFASSDVETSSWEKSIIYEGLCSNRSYSVATELMEAMTSDELKLFGQELLTGLVGSVKAGTMLGYRARNSNEVMSIDDLYSKPQQMFKKIDEWKAGNEMAKLACYVRLFQAHVATRKSIKELNMEIAANFLQILPTSLQGGTLKYIGTKLENRTLSTEFLIQLSKLAPSLFKTLEAILGGK